MKEFILKHKTTLIISSILLAGGYFIVFKNRRPNLKIDNNVDWSKKTVNVKFGNNKETIPYSTGSILAGSTFSDKYKLFYKVVGNKMIFEVKDTEGVIFDSKTVDFTSKIIY